MGRKISNGDVKLEEILKLKNWLRGKMNNLFKIKKLHVLSRSNRRKASEYLNK